MTTIPIQNTWQRNGHSCGMEAALAVAQYLVPGTSRRAVTDAIGPTAGIGTSRRRMVSALRGLGVRAEYRDDLTVRHLRRYVTFGVPVIISVWPDWWLGDHWTVVRGFGTRYVLLTNHYRMTVPAFKREWITNWGNSHGAGLVCQTY